MSGMGWLCWGRLLRGFWVVFRRIGKRGNEWASRKGVSGCMNDCTCRSTFKVAFVYVYPLFMLNKNHITLNPQCNHWLSSIINVNYNTFKPFFIREKFLHTLRHATH